MVTVQISNEARCQVGIPLHDKYCEIQDDREAAKVKVTLM